MFTAFFDVLFCSWTTSHSILLTFSFSQANAKIRLLESTLLQTSESAREVDANNRVLNSALHNGRASAEGLQDALREARLQVCRNK